MSGPSIAYPRRELSDAKPGVEREQRFSINREDVDRFSNDSGDCHPLHCDRQFSKERGYQDILVHGMLVSSRCSAFIAHEFVGSHGLLVAMSCDFRNPVFCGDELTWHGKVTRTDVDAGTVELDWSVTNIHGVVVQLGTACALLPRLS